MVRIVSNTPGLEFADNHIMIPQKERIPFADRILKALEIEDDVTTEDIEGDTVIIPFMMLFNAKRIQFTDIEREEE